MINALLARAIAQGMRGWIIDRSSTPDEHGRTAGTGHYDMLLALIPGSATRPGRLRRTATSSARGTSPTPRRSPPRRRSSCSRCTRC